MIHTAVIFIKPDSTHAFKTVEKLLSALKETSITPQIASAEENISFFKQQFPNIENKLFKDIHTDNSIAFSIGGDGTFLFTVQQVATHNIPIIAIHQGNRGFLTPFLPIDIPSIIKDISENNLNIRNIPFWKAEIENIQDPILFINEFILQRHSYAKMVKYTLNIENIGSMEGRADGVIFSSSTGSTAYNLTAGGSIIHPDVQAISITPICPHNLKHKAVIVPPCNITLTLNNDNAGIGYDGFSEHTLDEGKTIRISPSEHTLKYITPRNSNYLDHLNNKIF
jgi:NAD+ kinase